MIKPRMPTADWNHAPTVSCGLMTPLTFSPVQLAGYDKEGQLLFSGRTLVGIVARLSSVHGDQEGYWHIEYTGASVSLNHPAFHSLDDASAWFVDNVTT